MVLSTTDSPYEGPHNHIWQSLWILMYMDHLTICCLAVVGFMDGIWIRPGDGYCDVSWDANEIETVSICFKDPNDARECVSSSQVMEIPKY